jgi:hypothetical protein
MGYNNIHTGKLGSSAHMVFTMVGYIVHALQYELGGWMAWWCGQLITAYSKTKSTDWIWMKEWLILNCIINNSTPLSLSLSKFSLKVLK